MKKFFFSILAVGALVACTKSEVKYDEASEISFAPVAQKATKAVIDGTVYPTNIPFNVFSFYSVQQNPGAVTDYSSFDKVYLDNKTFDYKTEEALFGGKEHAYYWPKTGSLIFAGYSPDPSEFTSTSQSYNLKDCLTIRGFVQPTNTAETHDLMWFNHTSNSYRGYKGVPVTFTHACSWLTFYVYSATPDAKFTIKEVVLNDVVTKGTFNSKTPSWTLSSNDEFKEDVVVFDGSETVPISGNPMRIDDEGVILIPQGCTSATITYTMDNGAGVVIEQTQTFNLTAGIHASDWKLAYHYIYNINFSAEAILISPSVADWTDVAGDAVIIK